MMFLELFILIVLLFLTVFAFIWGFIQKELILVLLLSILLSFEIVLIFSWACIHFGERIETTNTDYLITTQPHLFLDSFSEEMSKEHCWKIKMTYRTITKNNETQVIRDFKIINRIDDNFCQELLEENE